MDCEICVESFDDVEPMVLACRCRKTICRFCIIKRLNSTARCPFCDLRWSIRNFIQQCENVTPANHKNQLLKTNDNDQWRRLEEQEKESKTSALGSGELRNYYEQSMEVIIKNAAVRSADQILADEELARLLECQVSEDEAQKRWAVEEEDARLAARLACSSNARSGDINSNSSSSSSNSGSRNSGSSSSSSNSSSSRSSSSTVSSSSKASSSRRQSSKKPADGAEGIMHFLVRGDPDKHSSSNDGSSGGSSSSSSFRNNNNDDSKNSNPSSSSRNNINSTINSSSGSNSSSNNSSNNSSSSSSRSNSNNNSRNDGRNDSSIGNEASTGAGTTIVNENEDYNRRRPTASSSSARPAAKPTDPFNTGMKSRKKTIGSNASSAYTGYTGTAPKRAKANPTADDSDRTDGLPWTCAQCTYSSNAAQYLACEVCFGVRGGGGAATVGRGEGR